MATRMQQRRGTAADWAAQNPVLSDGELGFERDTKVMKMGDGVTPWNDLVMPYLTAGGGTMTGPLSLVAPTQNAHAARKQDVDAKVSKTGDTMTGALTLNAGISGNLYVNGTITSLGNPRVFVQSGTPSGAISGDLWAW